MDALRQWRASAAWKDRNTDVLPVPKAPYKRGKGAHLLLMVQTADGKAMEAVDRYAKACRAKGEHVDILRYVDEKIAKGAPPVDDWFKDDLSYGKLPKPTAEAQFARKEYDVLLHASLTPFDAFDFLAAGVAAHYRVAPYEHPRGIYDLVISVPESAGVPEFIKQTERYLSVLNPG